MDKVYQEEQKKLTEIENIIDTVASRYEASAQKLQKEIDDYWTSDYNDIDNKRYLMRRYETDLESAEQFRSYQSSPYFGRLDLDAEDSDESTTFYIGKEGISDKAKIIVVDWRTPIGQCYYAHNQKEFLVKGTNYTLALKRALDIKDAVLISYNTEYDGETISLEGDVVDPFLLTVLKDKRRHNRLTDIIRTIQGNQNEIIRKPCSESFVVQGCAGSGKTMILLHRLSFLKFNNKNMSLNRVKIITPNKFFDAHINDLSVELGLTAIERYSVEEYYVSLIKRYSSKITADADVNSEKVLSVDLLGELYSLQYFSNTISHYHEYWEQLFSEVNESRLQQYFEKFKIAYPNTASHTVDTFSQLEHGIRQIVAAISEFEKKKKAVFLRLNGIDGEISSVQEEYERTFSNLKNIKKQTISRINAEIDALAETLKKREERIVMLRSQNNDLMTQRKQAEVEIEQYEAVLRMFSHNANTYSQYDSFVQINDEGSSFVRTKCTDIITEIVETEKTYDKTPVYSFVKRNALRKKIAESKQQFSTEVMRVVSEHIQEIQVKQEPLRNTINTINEKIAELANSIQVINKELRTIRSRSSALRECSILFSSAELPDMRAGLLPAIYKECASILSAYEEPRSVASNVSNRLNSLKKTKQNLKIEQQELIKNEYSTEEKAYIDECNKQIKKLQFSEITRNVMFRDLLAKYRQHKQKYQKTNYRHKLYLKLLYCSLYFARPLNLDNFLNIDEAQDISISEYQLLRMVLGDKCVFNLYGDINQSVYSYKGITDWNEVSDITFGNVYVLNENYRNTLQITDFCNKEFGAEVYPIGVSGEPVLEMDTVAAVKWILELKKANPEFRVAVIHRHGLKEIQEYLRSILAEQDVSWYSVDDKKLSVLSVETAKGLEFEMVVAIVDQMSNNEKYISYTRALERLAVVRDKFSDELDIDDSAEDIDEEFEEPTENQNTLHELHQLLANTLTTIIVSQKEKITTASVNIHEQGYSQLLVSQSDELNKEQKHAEISMDEPIVFKALSTEDSMILSEFNSILAEHFGEDHQLSEKQQSIVLSLYHGKSIACNAPSGSMKNVMLYLLALKEHQTTGKQTLITAEAHLQENELVLADKLGLKGGTISTMNEFLADFNKEKYDVIFVPYDFFKQHENIEPFIDYFADRVTYWGLDHPTSEQSIWKQLNNCGTALNSVMFLMEKTGFSNLDLSTYQRIDIAGTTDMGIVKKHTLLSVEAKLKWLHENLDELHGQGLIYCDDESTCKTLGKHLRKAKIMAEAYIDVTNHDKKESINYLTNSFINGGVPVLVTTQDTGKNLSNPNIRFIVHYDIPTDPELYQLHVSQIGQLASNAVVHDLHIV